MPSKNTRCEQKRKKERASEREIEGASDKRDGKSMRDRWRKMDK